MQKKNNAIPAFQNDSLVVFEDGKTASAVALEKVNSNLKRLFKNFDKNDFAMFIQKAWEVNEVNRLASETKENKVIIFKNNKIIMAGLDVLDFSIRRRFYLLNRDFEKQEATEIVQTRLKETARMDGITLPRLLKVNRSTAMDIQQVFDFKKVKEKPASKLDFIRMSNISVVHKFPNLVFRGGRWFSIHQR